MFTTIQVKATLQEISLTSATANNYQISEHFQILGKIIFLGFIKFHDFPIFRNRWLNAMHY